ncbi:uncharacterized protein LOC143291522 isoform X2 [Babylonia areolata]|uniref:uncharacterized protein LOC143291522 isoform X2 n=1 Tax=Babylonia areolata TaxID=304850 RepID=UPI003FD4B47C
MRNRLSYSEEIPKEQQGRTQIMEMGSAVSSPKPLILLVMVVMMMMTIGGTDGAVTCTAKTTSYETSVTCDFGRDISKTQEDFNIKFYHPDLGAESETKLMCNWLPEHEDRMICQSSKGVQFDKVVSHRLTFTAPPALDKVGGKYVCQVVPSTGVHIHPCDLIKGNESRTTEKNGPTTRLMEKIDAKATLALVLCIVALSAIVVIIITIIVVIIVCVRRPGVLEGSDMGTNREPPVSEDRGRSEQTSLVEEDEWENVAYTDCLKKHVTEEMMSPGTDDEKKKLKKESEQDNK